MKPVFEAWAVDLGKKDLEQPRRLFHMNLDDLKKLRAKIYDTLRKTLKAGGVGNKRIRMRAFEVTAYSATDLSHTLALAIAQTPRISSAKQARGLALQLARLRNQVLQAQQLYRPEKDRPEDIPTILDFELSKRILRLVVADLTDNYQGLKQLKRETDMAYYQVCLEQKRFGIEGDISHLELSLNLEDIETILKQYGLKGNLCHEDLQHFGTSYLARTRKTTEILDELARNLSKGGGIHEHLLPLFSQADYKAYKEGQIRTELMLALQVAYPELLESECHLLALVLNHASPTELLETTLFKNYMSMISLVSERASRVNVPRIWNHTRTWLENGYEVVTEDDNYDYNRKQLISSVQKIFQSQSS